MDLSKEFQALLKEGTITIDELSAFLLKKQAEYVKAQVEQLELQGHPINEAYNKASQSWRTKVGNALQSIIFGVLQEYFDGKDVKLTSDKHLTEQNSKNPELDLVRRMLLIHYDKYSFLPDADIIIYSYRIAIMQGYSPTNW